MTKLFTALTASAVLGIASLAYADDARACGAKGGHVMASDANGDGKVDKTELTASLTAKSKERFELLDTNKDGFIDQAERAAMLEHREAKMERKGKHKGDHMTRVDQDNDGKLSLVELQAADGERAAKMMERLDVNKDGAIDGTEAEKMGGKKKHHERA